MKVKKTIAAIAAVTMLGVSLGLTPAALESVLNSENEIETYAENDAVSDDDTAIPSGDANQGNTATEDVPDESIGYYRAGVLNEEEYSTLTEEQKSEYYKISLTGPISLFVIFTNSDDITTRMPISDGAYVWRNEPAWDIIYVNVQASDYPLVSNVYINGVDYMSQLVMNDTNAGYLYEFDVSNYTNNELTVEAVTPDIKKGVISPEYYDFLTEAQQSYYTKTIVSGNAYFIPGLDIDNNIGDVVSNGIYYTHKGMELYIGAYAEQYAGHDILVNNSKIEVFESGDTMNYGTRGIYVPETGELNISMAERELTDYEKANYVKINIGSGTYVVKNTHQWLSDSSEHLIDIYNGDYVRKGDYYYIAAWADDYEGNEIYLNGEKLDVRISGDGENYGTVYQVKDTDTELTVKLVKKPVEEPAAPAENTESTQSSPAAENNNSSQTENSAAPSAEQTVKQVQRAAAKNVTVDASKTGITKNILSAFANNKKSEQLTVKCDKKLQIEISKDDISGEVMALDFTKGNDFLSKKQIESSKLLKNVEKIVQLNFISKGDFGGIDSVTVKTKIDKNLAGKTANVYEYKNGKLVRIGSCKISAAGNAKFKADHYGKYVIAVL